ncbi:hypothetical protein TNCV_2316361 [Trichonephila clavipes]|nr:hypothetical protein TNCV_2316361 [Trichonephila clavipes]
MSRASQAEKKRLKPEKTGLFNQCSFQLTSLYSQVDPVKRIKGGVEARHRHGMEVRRGRGQLSHLTIVKNYEVRLHKLSVAMVVTVECNQ